MFFCRHQTSTLISFVPAFHETGDLRSVLSAEFRSVRIWGKDYGTMASRLGCNFEFKTGVRAPSIAQGLEGRKALLNEKEYGSLMCLHQSSVQEYHMGVMSKTRNLFFSVSYLLRFSFPPAIKNPLPITISNISPSHRRTSHAPHLESLACIAPLKVKQQLFLLPSP